MGVLIVPRRFNQQPQQAVQLDRTNPLCAGLIAAAIPHLRLEAVNNGAAIQVGTYAIGQGRSGVGLLTNGSSNNLYFRIPQIALTQWTIFGQFVSSSNAPDSRAMNLGRSTDPTPYIQIGAGNVNPNRIRVLTQTDGSALPANQESVGTAFDGTLHTVALTYNGQNVRCYIDGILDTTAGTSTGNTWTIDTVNFGSLQRSNDTQFWSGLSIVGLAYRRAIGADEIQLLQTNPWQIFAAPPRRLWAVSSGVQSYSYTASGGMAFSGAAPVVRSIQKAASGGLTISGTAAQRRGAVRAASGGLVLSGAATAQRGRAVAPSGGLVFAGTAPYTPTSSNQSRIVTPSGGIAFSGAATVVRKMNYTPTGGIVFGGAAGYTNSGIVVSLMAVMRRRARPRVFPTQ